MNIHAARTGTAVGAICLAAILTPDVTAAATSSQDTTSTQVGVAAGGRESVVTGVGFFDFDTSAARDTTPHDQSRATPRRPQTPVTYILDPQVRWDDTRSGFCLYLGQREGDPNSRLALDNEFKTLRLAAQYPLCSGSPRPSGKPTPGAAAALAWSDTKNLPHPTVWMAPGKAITGLEGCLEIGGPSTMPIDYPDVFGMAIHIDAATSNYLVDWGDGTTTETTDRGGACDKGGKLRHTYQYKGNKTITVTQRWTATWSAGSASGAITDVLETVGTLPLDVFEIQPVIANPPEQ